MIYSVEDPFDKEDWEHIKRLNDLGICQVCYFFLDKIFVFSITNPLFLMIKLL